MSEAPSYLVFTPPAPVTPEAPVTPPVDFKAKAIAAATGKTIETPKPDATPTPEVKPAKIDMDAATLKQLTKQAREIRENQAKIAQLEATAPDAATFANVKKLYSEGKRMEAIALMSGKEPTTEMEFLMADYLNAPTDAAQDEAKDALAAKVEELAAKDAAREKDAEDQKKAADIDAEKQRNAAVTSFAHKILDEAKAADGSLTFELCARDENRVEAAAAALEIVKTLAFDRYTAVDPTTGERTSKDVTQEQAAELYREAYIIVEAEYDEIGQKRYLKRDRPRSMNASIDPRRPTTPSPGPRIEPQSRPSPSITKAPISTNTPATSLTPAQAKQKAIDSIRGFAT